MSAQTLLSGGDKWFSYSGELFGDVSAPSTIQLNLIPNTGLRDSYVRIMPFFDRPVSSGTGVQLGIQVKLNDTTVVKSQYYGLPTENLDVIEGFSLFIPRQSKLEIVSLNTSGNNTQIRGCNLIGYYL